MVFYLIKSIGWGWGGLLTPGAYGTLWRHRRSRFLKNLKTKHYIKRNLLKFKETGRANTPKTAKNRQNNQK